MGILMTRTTRFLSILPYLLLLCGCSGSQQFTAIPPGLDRNAAARMTVEMTAEDFHFTPEVVRVKAGTLVTLKIKSIDGTHGFDLGAFGIDERLEEGKEKIVEFYAPRPGEYGFRCSHFCGLGHLGMTGKIIVE